MTPGAPGVLAVVGPTASGKSALGVELARRCNGEVVNADAFALYRGMDIGTATPTAAERRGVPHHLFDLWSVDQPASVVEYQRAARAVITAVLDRGRTPVLVGGSGLYVRAALDDIRFPGTDPVLRSELEAELAAVGPAPLHARLRQLDPPAAAAILPSNGRRLVRALEVVALTGSFSATLPSYSDPWLPTTYLGLDPDLPALDERIEARTAAMFAGGLVEEVERLVDAGLERGPTAGRGIGYAQVLAWRRGELATLEEARADTARATRRLVRRQRSWFRRDPRVAWAPDAASVLAGRA
jgi:tRNA dimethylallyltransferase